MAVTDASGNAIGTNTYDEYGIPATSPSGMTNNMGRFQYTGQIWVPEIGLYYYKARMYSPTYGRFMQTDPIGYGDGMNMYGYVNADPVNATDPMGLFCIPGGWVGYAGKWAYTPSECYNSNFGSTSNGGGDAQDRDLAQQAFEEHGREAARQRRQNGCGNGGAGGVRDFLWGAGDVALLGFGDELRDALGIDPVNMNSTAYTAGEITGSVALLATGVGGGIRAAGAAARGLEFSHFIPARMGGARSIWNGNFVSTATHGLSDPFRYRFMPRSWKAANPMPNRASQLWTRTPNTAKGTAAGAGAAGTGLANAGC